MTASERSAMECRGWEAEAKCLRKKMPQALDFVRDCGERWNVPIVSLYADGRRTLGVAADGGMIEGVSG